MNREEPPLFSGSVVHNGLVYIAGKGYHEEGDITTHTNGVLDALEEELARAGSSMDRVLEVNVYLHDLNDYAAMNEAYRGRFGDNPPTVATESTGGGSGGPLGPRSPHAPTASATMDADTRGNLSA